VGETYVNREGYAYTNKIARKGSAYVSLNMKGAFRVGVTCQRQKVENIDSVRLTATPEIFRRVKERRNKIKGGRMWITSGKNIAGATTYPCEPVKRTEEKQDGAVSAAYREPPE